MCSLLLVTAITLTVFLNINKGSDLTRLEANIRKHIILPDEEVPAMLTVTDQGKLSTPFLSKAKNGDKILIYQDAKKAIIYRPSIDRIVDVGPVSIGAVQE